MNICFVYKNFPIDKNFDSGIGMYLFNLIQKLKKENNIIVITTSNTPRVIYKKRLTIYALNYHSDQRRSVSFIKHLIHIAYVLPKIIKKHNVDIIEFANWEAEGYIFTSTVNKFLKIPVVIRLHTPSFIDNRYGNHAKYFSEKFKESIEKKFVNQPQNHLTSSTHYNSNVCKEIYSIKKSVEIIPLGIEIKNNVGNQPTKDRKFLTILYVGRLEKRKGIDILIKAIPRILQKNKNIRFIITGKENNNSKWITKIRNTLPVQYLYKINFLGYIDNPHTLDKIYEDSDICIIPSRYESLGLTVLEAMSYGKATIASKVGGIPEIITNNINGILVKPNDIIELSSAIISLSKKPHFRKTLGINARNTVKNKLSLKILSDRSTNYYQFLITGK